ncbi:MAG: 23S rRNA (guanine(745)-N(1))-methyltransferase [Acidimicrobiales bacterium]
MCREELLGAPGHLACARNHTFDVARQGYVNLLTAAQRRSRQPGDTKEMVDARRRFLASGAYDRISDAVTHVVQRAGTAAASRWPGGRPLLLDIGCGEGHHTRRIDAALRSGAGGLDPVELDIAGIDVSKAAVALAARAHPSGFYAVASAADLPLADGSVDIAVNIFGPVIADELARVVRRDGTVVVAHPGPVHLSALRALVYDDPRPHEIKDPLRHSSEHFARVGTMTVTFPVVVLDRRLAQDLFAMTPYRWHAPPDIVTLLTAAAEGPGGFETRADVIVSTYRRTEKASF